MSFSSDGMEDKIAFLVVGNKFERIPDREASLDRSRQFKKKYRVSVYVDDVGRNENIIWHIEANYGETFPRKFKSSIHPKKIHLQQEDGNPAVRWRWFHNSQHVYGMFDITFTITGIGGTKATIRYKTRMTDHEEPFQFFEPNPHLSVSLRFPPEPLPEDIGYQLKFDAARGITTHQSHGESTLEYRRDTASFLSGDVGIKQLQNHLGNRVQQQQQQQQQKENNGLCSPRVKIKVPDQKFTTSNIRKVCLNAIKYEDVMESLFWDPNDRKGIIPYHSNKEAMSETTNKAMHDRINSCQNFDDLKRCLNPSSPSLTYRFNLYKQEKVFEFCFCSVDVEKLETLVRFCVHFVNNSIRLLPPSSFKDVRIVHYKMEFLFRLIKDPYHILGPVDSSMESSVASFAVNEDDDMSISTTLTTHDPQNAFSIETCLIDSSEPPSRKRQRQQQQQNDDNMIIDSSNPPTGGQHQAEHRLPTQSNQLHGSPASVVDFQAPQYNWKRIQSSDDCQNETVKSLRRLLSMLNATIDNQKFLNLQALQRYIEARRTELSSYFGETKSTGDLPTVAVEVVNVEQGQKKQDNIYMYMPGGKKLEREKRTVEQPSEELTLSDIEEEEEMGHILRLLNLPVPPNLDDQIKQFDHFIINDCFNSNNAKLSDGDPQVPRFAIIRVDKK